MAFRYMLILGVLFFVVFDQRHNNAIIRQLRLSVGFFAVLPKKSFKRCTHNMEFPKIHVSPEHYTLKAAGTWREVSLIRQAYVLMALAIGVLFAGPVWSDALPGYALHEGDQIEVSVWQEEELRRQILIPPDGRISFPLAGEIVAAGRTVAQIQLEITAKLIKYIPEAVVTVSVTGIDGNRVYVIGQVNNPGSFVMNPQINILQALSLARGTTPFAAVDDIKVIRGTGAEQRVYEFKYNEISKGRNLAQNIDLESGDVVIVP